MKDGVLMSSIHLVWPYPITSEQMWALRALELRALEGCADVPKFAKSWQEMYDTAIFGSNGLRMIFSNKASSCELCKHKASNSRCSSCGGRGIVDQGRPFKLLFIADAECRILKDKTEFYQRTDNLYDLVRLCTIRNFDPQPVHYDALDAAMSLVVRDKRNNGVREKRARSPDDEPQKVEDSNVFNAIAGYILRTFPGDPNVKAVRKLSGSCYVASSDCHYCENKGGLHGNSTTYFVVTSASGAFQKCWCSKCYKSGPCSLFRGRSYDLPPELIEILFPIAVARREAQREKIVEPLRKQMRPDGKLDLLAGITKNYIKDTIV